MMTERSQLGRRREFIRAHEDSARLELLETRTFLSAEVTVVDARLAALAASASAASGSLVFEHAPRFESHGGSSGFTTFGYHAESAQAQDAADSSHLMNHATAGNADNRRVFGHESWRDSQAPVAGG